MIRSHGNCSITAVTQLPSRCRRPARAAHRGVLAADLANAFSQGIATGWLATGS